MLPLSPVEHPELSTEEEQLMIQEAADALFDQLNDDICDLLSEHIANRIEINVKVVK